MADVGLVVAIIVAATVAGQMIWLHHQKEREQEYQRLFLSYVQEFLRVAQDPNSAEAGAYLQECIDQERVCIAAQEAVRGESFIWPWRWCARWRADYFKEASGRA